MKKSLIFWVAAIGFAFNPQSAWAEMLEGRITAIHPDSMSVTLECADLADQRRASLSSEASAVTVGTVSLEVSVDAYAKVNGFTLLDDLEVGNHVLIDADKDNEGAWEAKSLEKTGFEDIKAKVDAENSINKQKFMGGALNTPEPLKLPGQKALEPDVEMMPNEYDPGTEKA